MSLRRLVTLLITITLLSSSFGAANALNVKQQSDIEQAFMKRYEAQDDKDKSLSTLQQKLLILQIKFTNQTFIQDVLSLIGNLIEVYENKVDDSSETETQEEIHTENDTEDTPTSTEILDSFSVNKYDTGEKIILAGKLSPPVATREIIAQREAIEIQEIELQSSINIDTAVAEGILVDSDGRILGRARPVGNTIRFRNISYLLPMGSQDIYLLLDTFETGDGNPGEDIGTFTFDMYVEGEGERSSQTISQTYNNSDDVVTISPIKITDMRIVHGYDGYKTDKKLYDGASTDVALIVIETAQQNNYRTDAPTEVNTLLTQLQIRFLNGTTDANIGSAFRIERVDKNTAKISGAVNGNELVFDLNSLSKNANLIEGGERAVLLLSVTPELDGIPDNEYLEIALEGLDSGAITYGTDSPGASLLNALYLHQELANITIED